MLYFTELLGLKVYDLKQRTIGRIVDAALVPLEDPARVDRFFVGGGWAWMTVRHSQVRSISLDGIQLRDEMLTPYHSDEFMLRIARDLLDQQIIDVHGRKVVRVTDVTFEIRPSGGGEELFVLEVDIGLRSIFRRLMQGVLPPRWIRWLQQPVQPNSIRWDFCNIVEADPLRRLRLNITMQGLQSLHPADIADIVEELGAEERGAIIEAIDSEVAAEALSEVDPGLQASIIESLETEKAAEIIEEMAPDQAADVLAELEEETSEQILEEMDPEPKLEVRELLEYAEDTAGGMMTTEFVALHENATVADATMALRGNEELLESLNTLFLLDSDRGLAGAVPVARLCTASATTPLRHLSVSNLVYAGAKEPQDRVTELFDKYNLLTLPVVDDKGRMAGVITADDIITVLRRS